MEHRIILRAIILISRRTGAVNVPALSSQKKQITFQLRGNFINM